MEKYFMLLNIPTPIWSHIISFFVGLCTGALAVGFKRKEINIESIIMYILIFFYALAIARSAVSDAEYPPIEVTALIGALSGAMNEKIGANIREILKSRRNDK